MTLVTCDFQPWPHRSNAECDNPQPVVPDGEMDVDFAVSYILVYANDATELSTNPLAAPAVYLAHYVQQMRD